MKIENPFESGHIKNYILLYASVVAIMILFFFASTLFQEDTKKIEQKSFNTKTPELKKPQTANKETSVKEKKFKLLQTNY